MVSNIETRLTFRETDEADKPIATFVFSEQDAPSKGTASIVGRVDVMVSDISFSACVSDAELADVQSKWAFSWASYKVMKQNESIDSSSWSTRPIITYLSDVFLPSGYPQSVSDDYLPYQIFVSQLVREASISQKPTSTLGRPSTFWVQSQTAQVLTQVPRSSKQDSLQAFCSSIAGLLSSRAVLQGVGVGNADASPTSALLLHILQDTSGRIATILFAHRVGTALEPECKTYRLAADVFNDVAMILDCLSPMVPAGAMRVSILSTAGVLRALCGVAGGSSKASLSAHFAKWGNLAELNAKDSSQETVISLVGMLVGSVVVSHVTSFTTTWAALLTLLALHLSLNYAAVRAVQMTSLNRQRANIVFSALFDSDADIILHPDTLYLQIPAKPSSKTRSRAQISRSHPSTWVILSPAQVASQERIFHRDGALQWLSTSTSPTATKNSPQDLGSAEIGISLASFFTYARHQPSHDTTSTAFRTPIPMAQLTALFTHESYLLFLFPTSSKWHASILLKKGCSVRAQLKGWAHALLAARVLSSVPSAGHSQAQAQGQSQSRPKTSQEVFEVVARVLDVLNEGGRFEGYVDALEGGGWEVDVGAMETRGGRRVDCN
ncbi:uncharacterized protein N7482_008589 [Penicillium canariense]|uniref:DUF647 domain-containing protein n=1 Tax=Penicillium canariense TaxID=189055 RepID=A0A9W9HYP7_9EURO|nr:uncharacterized protein N7482_008589 [Penicillium canariense]KAJ5157489.1 hypothetical protein N7482_008589 [Penicillium canariense]